MWVPLKLAGGTHLPSALMEFEIQFYPVCGLVVPHTRPPPLHTMVPVSLENEGPSITDRQVSVS